MQGERADSNKLADLRQKAEQALRDQPVGVDELPADDVRRLFHELRVHQIELEMQNDQLRRAQDELQASRDKYFDLYDMAPVGYFTLSQEGLILETNLAGAAMLGVERARLVKKPLSRFMFRDDQATFSLRHQAAFATRTRQTCDLGMVKKDGAPFYVHLECIVTQDGDGDILCRVVISDVSAQVRAEQALQEYAERLKDMVAERTQKLLDAQEQLVRREKLATLGQLAGGVAHELRNPLGAIGQAAYFLNMVLPEPDSDVKQALDIIDREVKRSSAIIRSLLDFARAAPPVRRKVDVNEIVRQSLSHIGAPESIEVLCQLDETLPGIAVDPTQLALVFDNLILNAVQAMTPPYAGDEGGRLTVCSEVADGGWVAVSFADTGAGIPPENLDKIFEPLFTTKAKGIGLGLAMSKRLVEGHEGRIEVQSEVGKGSCFTVLLG